MDELRKRSYTDQHVNTELLPKILVDRFHGSYILIIQFFERDLHRSFIINMLSPRFEDFLKAFTELLQSSRWLHDGGMGETGDTV